MPLTLAPSTESESLPERLRGLLSRFRRVLVLREGSRVALVALLLTALFAWLDWRYRLPALVRAGALASLLTGTWLLALRSIIVPWRRERDCLAMAQRVERYFPEYNDSLISAVQFLDVPDEQQVGSPVLRRGAIQFATEIADTIDFHEAVPSPGLKRSLLALILVLAGAVWLFDRAPEATGQALARLFVPFGAAEWPAKTTIEILAPQPLPHRLAKREWFEMRFQVRGVIPDRVSVNIWEDGGRPIEQIFPMSKAEQAAGEATPRVSLEPDRVERSFRFRVRANDADTGWQRVEVLAPPILVPRDGRPSPQIHLDYPDYTQLAPADLPDGSSVIETVTGARVSIRAAADRPVAKARFVVKPSQPRLPLASFLAMLGARNALDGIATFALSREVWSEIPVRLTGDGRLLDIDFIPRLSGQHVLRIEDETGIGSERTFDVRVEPDPAPKVVLLRPARSDATGLVPEAAFELTALANDHRFALRQVFLEYRTGASEPFRRLDLFDAPTVSAVVPPLTALMHPPLHYPAGRFPRLQTYGIDRKRSLRAFTHPDGAALKVGDVLTLRVGANDFDNVTWNKAPGYSDIIDLPIVSKAQIEAVLEQQLAQTRNDLLLLRDLQQDARQKIAGALKALETSGQLDREQMDRLQQAEQGQEQIRTKIGAAKESLLARLARMQQAVVDNRLPRSITTQRIESTEAELGRLAREEVGPPGKYLEQARRENTTAKPALTKAERHQREIEETLQTLLERLQPWSGAGEVRAEARSVLGELRKQIEILNQLQQGLKPGLAGSNRDDLPEAQRAELDRAALRQERTAERVRQLLENLDKLADAKKDPAPGKSDKKDADDDQARQAEANALRNAKNQVNGPALRKQLQEVPGQIRNNQLGDAQNSLQRASVQLEKFVASLEDKPKPDDPDRLQKKARETESQIDQMIGDQERLEKKIEAAKQIADPAKRAEELRNLSREQEKIRQQALEAAKQLTRNGNDLAAQNLRRAARQMEEARQQMEQGQPPEANRDETLDRLDEAQEQVERNRERADQELMREKLVQAADVLKGLRDRQAAAIAEGRRVQAKVRQDGKWDQAVARNTLPALLDQQQALAKELRSVIDKRFGGDPVFKRMLHQAADAMQAAVALLDERKEDVLDQLEGKVDFNPKLEAQAELAIQSAQEIALKRLDQLLEALQPDPEMLRPPPKQTAPPKTDDVPPKEAPKQKPNDALPPLAQLKALRSLQADLCERTAAFDQAHPDRTKLTPAETTELNALLKAITKAQIDIADLVRELQPEQPTGDEP